MANRNINGDVNVEFTEASSRQGLDSGESVKTLFGKIRKWLSDLKAVAFSGSYNDLTNKPTIPPIVISETSDTTPYIYKASEHDAVYDELVGGSVAWNQLIPTTGTSGNNNGVTFTNNGDGSWTLNGTTTSSLVIRNLNYAANKKNFVDGHKYLMYADSDDSNVGIAIIRDVGSAHYAYGKTAKIISYAEGSETASWARMQLSVSGYKVTNVITKPQVFDLTQMFGTTIADYVYSLEQSTAGSGVEWLKSYGFFTKDYYPYNAESLISVNTSGKMVVGKNLLELTTSTLTTYGITYIGDSETGIVTATGTAAAISSGAQFSIPIPAELVGNYYFSALTSTGADSTYDAYVWCLTDGARAKKWNGTTNSSSDYGNGNVEIRLEAGKTYVLNLRVKNTVNNLVFKPMIRRADTDSTFEPYTSISYPIQSTDLRGLYKLNGNKLYTDGDIYSADGQITRKYGYRDYQSGDESRTNAITDGTHTIYKLSAPTTENAQPFASPQMVYRNGTEEYLDTRDVPIPVGGNRKYVDIPDWMVNEYFDDVRAETSTLLVKIENINNGINEIKSDMRGVTQDLDDISEELDCLTIQAALVNNEVVIQNTSDFTDELYSKYFSYTKPKFAILELHITSSTYYYKALINCSSVRQALVMEASFIEVNGTYMSIYKFNWSLSGTVGTPTVSHTSLNLGS